ncbi:MAG: hypothetical protein ACREPY_01345 [Rhodanobacteraceae bacterium]
MLSLLAMQQKVRMDPGFRRDDVGSFRMSVLGDRRVDRHHLCCNLYHPGKLKKENA